MELNTKRDGGLLQSYLLNSSCEVNEINMKLGPLESLVLIIIITL